MEMALLMLPITIDPDNGDTMDGGMALLHIPRDPDEGDAMDRSWLSREAKTQNTD